jgi:hypothetical protein
VRRASAGEEVGLYVDLAATVEVGDAIETRSGRRYLVVAVRRQERGKHAGRQHLRAVVMGDAAYILDGTIHRIRWYRRGRASGGVSPRGR